MADFPTALTTAVDNTTDALAKHLNNLEAKVGINDSAVETSLDYKIRTGYIPIGHTCTYASTDDPTYTFTIAGFDATALLSPGMKIKLTDSGTQCFFVTKVVFDDPGSTITVYGGTDYDLSEGVITNPFYSTQKAPLNFPLDPTKWTVELNNTTAESQASPTGGTWYNLGTITIDIPIGLWRVKYMVAAYHDVGTGANRDLADANVTLSTANNSVSDADFTARILVKDGDTANDNLVIAYLSREKYLNLATKDTYYLIVKTNEGASESLKFDGVSSPTIIRAICAYL